MIDPNSKVTKLLWLDMEMTGLDPLKDRILEVASITTDLDFNELDSYESVVFQADEVLVAMDPWCQENHAATGLIDRVKAAPNEKHVEIEFLDYLKRNFNEPAILSGNSIHQDRRFIKSWWPEVDRLLHYRMLDVTAYKILMENKYNIEFVRDKSHTAMDDINRSIEELKYYLKFFKVYP